MRWPVKLRWGDFIVMLVFAALGLGGLWYNLFFYEGGQQKYVEIYVDNELVKEISLEEGDERVFEVPFEADGETHYAEVEVKDGKVRMMPMEEELCPRGICSHTGWISSKHETIVCMPNQILVTFSEAEAEEDLDGETY